MRAGAGGGSSLNSFEKNPERGFKFEDYFMFRLYIQLMYIGRVVGVKIRNVLK